jgi:succinate dehydrogenase/fumarate reductase iron-sulfur protein
MKDLKVICYRYDRDKDEKPYYATYNVPVDDENVSVMDILNYIYENLDPTISYFSHAACKQDICGRCTVKVNGKSVLACKESIIGDVILLEPVNKEKVIKDLICRLD